MSPGPVTLRVLVVDDNRDAADTLADLLRLYGADVRACYSAESALAILGTFDFEAAILDIHMPDVDGCELAQRLRTAAPARILLVALTGVSDDEARRRTAEAGFDLHLTKASASEILVAALAAFGRWLFENRIPNGSHSDGKPSAPN